MRLTSDTPQTQTNEEEVAVQAQDSRNTTAHNHNSAPTPGTETPCATAPVKGASGCGGSGRKTQDVQRTYEEPLTNTAYCHDGTLEGLFSAIFEAYARHEDPLDVAPQATLQPRLGQTVRYIETDLEHALRVQRGVKRTCGTAAYDAVMQASLSDNPDAGTIVYRFIRYAMAQNRPQSCAGCKKRNSCSGPSTALSCPRNRKKGVLDDLAHPCVEPLHRLARAVSFERHRMLQFLRFEQLENGVWLARCNPNASVVPLIMDWFSGRFNTQPFIIYDEVHHLAGVYEGKDWYLVPTNELQVPGRAANEELMQAAWKRFYRTVAVEARYNPELRRQFMPKRFWKNILEMHEDLPHNTLAHPSTTQERLWRG